jgi:hypothetical protein
MNILILDEMNKMRNVVFAIIMMAGTYYASYAQDTQTDNHNLTVVVPQVTLLDLETTVSKDFSMNIMAPTEAGLKTINAGQNLTTWLNYTSVAGAGVSRKVMMSSNINPPGGVEFSVEANIDAGAGAGTPGTPFASSLEPLPTPTALITGIGSCYTGTGPNKGHRLIYRATVPTASFGLLRAGSFPVIVTYTLMDM